MDLELLTTKQIVTKVHKEVNHLLNRLLSCYHFSTVLHGELAVLSTRTLYARCRACREGYSEIAYVYRAVDGLEYNGVRYRTVSGWKHSSTKVILAGVIILRSRFYKQKLFYFTSIGSGTVFIFVSILK